MNTIDSSEYIGTFQALAKAILGDTYDERSLGNSTSSNTEEFLGLFGVDQLCSDLELPRDFLHKLLACDDWTLVLRLIALIEAALTHAITINLNRDELKEHFAYLELANTRIGKVAIAYRLDIINKDEKRFICKLAEIRNYFTHDVRNATTDLKVFLRRVSAADLKGYEKAFRLGYDGQRGLKLQPEPGKYDRRELVKGVAAGVFPEVPKLAIWFCALECLGSIYGVTKRNQLINQKDKLIGELIDNILLEK